MAARNLQKIEAEFFRSLNQFVEPIVRLGFGSPLPWTSGTIVLEMVGRKSGDARSIPLVATLVGDLILVGTVRKRSQWVKNLAASPEVKYWIYGRQREARAFVFAADSDAPQNAEMPKLAACLAQMILPQSKLFGVSFAILVPQ
jgi:deazaflavin-dependent oxidoreductase (nitroreductase family)